VINRIYGTTLDALTDMQTRNTFYHTWQIPFAILVTFLMGSAQYLKYRQSDKNIFLKKVSKPLFFALIATVLLVIIFRFKLIDEFLHILLLFTTLFAIAANVSYFLEILKGKW